MAMPKGSSNPVHDDAARNQFNLILERHLAAQWRCPGHGLLSI